MLFVQNYAVYEYVVVESVRALVANVNFRGLQFASTRPELLGMALDPEFASVIDGSVVWAKNMRMRKTDAWSRPDRDGSIVAEYLTALQ